MKKSLVIYLTAGYPDPKTFLKAADVAADEGVDLLEIGLPFSDPIADGPVIQKTSSAAIQSGIHFDTVLELADRMPRKIPKVVMTYANPLFVRGWAESFSRIEKAGFSGCILPDLPVEELIPLLPLRPSPNFYLVPFAAPTTTARRIKSIAGAAQDGAFIYLVSLRGITGAKIAAGSVEEIGALTRKIRQFTHAPVYVGFGIHSGPDAVRFASVSDGVIVGTAALTALARGIAPFARLIRELRSALDLKN